MIVDASVAIALRSPDDRHAAAAERIVVAAESLVIHPVTLAESLVVPARRGQARSVRDLLVDRLGFVVATTDADEPVRVAELRAATTVHLPDCYPLALAEHLGEPLATFDTGLAAAARARGIIVVP